MPLLDEIDVIRKFDQDDDTWYSVTLPADIVRWVQENFTENIDFTIERHLRGVWLDMPGKILTAIRLKF